MAALWPGKLGCQKLVVHWPGGTREEIAGDFESGRYTVTQGSGKAVTVEGRREIALAPQTTSKLDTTAAARIVLPSKIAMPTLFLTSDEDSGTNTPFANNGRPTLIIFWISSCPNCAEELTDLAQHESELTDAEVDVLAISLDGLDASASRTESHMKDARDVLAKMKFPFDAAGTTAETIDIVRHFQNALFNKYPEFVVPLSFLTDADGQIVSIYRGAVSHDVILQDLELMNQSAEARRDLATPVPGSWITKPATQSQMAEFVARRLYARAPEEGFRYYELAMNLERDNNRKDQLGKRIAATRVSLGVNCAKQGDLDGAERHFREALRLRPNDPTARKNLDRILQRKQ